MIAQQLKELNFHGAQEITQAAAVVDAYKDRLPFPTLITRNRRLAYVIFVSAAPPVGYIAGDLDYILRERGVS